MGDVRLILKTFADQMLKYLMDNDVDDETERRLMGAAYYLETGTLPEGTLSLSDGTFVVLENTPIREVHDRYIEHTLGRSTGLREAADTLGVATTTVWEHRRKSQGLPRRPSNCKQDND